MLILDEVKKIVNQRGNEYGSYHKSFDRVAKIASVILGKPINEYDICIIMAAIKLSRIANNKYKQDSWIDLIAYIAFASDFLKKDDPVVSEEEIEEIVKGFFKSA